jgi:hypothetical protein
MELRARGGWTRVVATVTAAAFFLCSGCSLFVPAYQRVSVSATNPQALIYVDGQLVGTGTASPRLRRNEDHAVMARVDDRVGTAHIGTRLSGVGIVDIVGCALLIIPCLGIGAGGFRTLDTQNVLVTVPPPAAPALPQ